MLLPSPSLRGYSCIEPFFPPQRVLGWVFDVAAVDSSDSAHHPLPDFDINHGHAYAIGTENRDHEDAEKQRIRAGGSSDSHLSEKSFPVLRTFGFSRKYFENLFSYAYHGKDRDISPVQLCV